MSLQIVEEQLSFPSGTATAHLISVLHQLPPPDTTVRQRRGYRQLDSEDGAGAEVLSSPSATTLDDEAEHDEHERQALQREGWQDLIWSFAASGLMTVGQLKSIHIAAC